MKTESAKWQEKINSAIPFCGIVSFIRSSAIFLPSSISQKKFSLMKNILITGGAGFIGANFVPYFIENNPDYHLVNLDLLTYAGNLDNVKEVSEHPRYTFVQGDICDRIFIEELFEKYQFHDVIHFAAESHVDNSISGPEAFIKTNVLGTFNLLDTARKLWMNGPNDYKAAFENARFHHVSTDEVYGTLGETGLFEETTPYAPNSPYSASKAGSDMIVRQLFPYLWNERGYHQLFQQLRAETA